MNSIVVGHSPVIWSVCAALIVLVGGDFASTFFYHVPQHVWGKLHLRTHHDKKRSYWDHAVLSRNPAILLDGFLGALPYMLIAVACARLSVIGALVGLALGQLHVWWRHTCDLGWRTPAWLLRVAPRIALVLPEDHNRHHVNPELYFGDIFRFYDVPARRAIAWLRAISPRRRGAAAARVMRRLALQRLQRMRARRHAVALRALWQRKSPAG